MKNLIILVLVSIVYATNGYAFPNLVRKGYTSCYNCHFNQNGGGSINSYGKYVAADEMGTFNDFDSAQGWLTKMKGEDSDPEDQGEYVAAFLGRWGNVNVETYNEDFKRVISMQSDIELAFRDEGWTGLLTFGQRLDSYNPDKGEKKDDLFIRRFYIGRHTEDYSLRIGKFFPEFGINHQNHALKTRGGLYFGPNQEPMTVQATYFSRYFDVSIAAVSGNDETKLQDSSGIATKFELKTDSMMGGFSYIDMRNDKEGTGDNAMSLHGSIGYKGHGYTMAEFVEKKQYKNNGSMNVNRIGYIESGWEFYKGVTPFVNMQYDYDFTRDSYSRDTGFGVQLTPWTHYELNFQYFSNTYPGGASRTSYGTLNIYY